MSRRDKTKGSFPLSATTRMPKRQFRKAALLVELDHIYDCMSMHLQYHRDWPACRARDKSVYIYAGSGAGIVHGPGDSSASAKQRVPVFIDSRG
jgi:hypothetical protein